MSPDDFEARFWGNCCNTFGEETKQLLYMHLMGFPIVRTWRSSFTFDMGGRSVIDVGGGPCSVLLKCDHLDTRELRRSVVIDPAEYPTWVRDRYLMAGIDLIRAKGEDLTPPSNPQWRYSLALIYNVLQHTEDPEKVVANALGFGEDLRMFEWIDIPPHEGHPHMLTEENLNRWTGKKGQTIQLHGENECTGRAWYL